MAGNMNTLMCIRTVCDGTAGPHDYTTTRGFEVVDVSGAGTVTVGAATGTVQRQPAAGGGYSPVSAAVPIDTIDDIEYSTSIFDAQNTFATGDSHRVAIANAAQGNIYTWVVPTSWISG